MRTRAWSVFAAAGAAATRLHPFTSGALPRALSLLGAAAGVVERADVALHAAERSGRDRTLLATR